MHSDTLSGAVAACRAGAPRRFHAGAISRMPRTRLTAATKYPAPQIGHQRSPACSMKAVRSSHA